MMWHTGVALAAETLLRLVGVKVLLGTVGLAHVFGFGHYSKIVGDERMKWIERR